MLLSIAPSGGGGWCVAVQDAVAVGTSCCCCAVRVKNQLPAPAVDGYQVMIGALCRAADYAAFGVEVLVVQGLCCWKRGIIRR
jgi:hypothetical protein